MSMFETLQRLLDAEVDFVLVGGLAVALHGYQRVTLDIDLVLAMTPENLRRFIGIAKSDGLRPIIPVPIEALADHELIERWHREKGMLAFALRGENLSRSVIDVLVKSPVPYDQMRRDAVLVPVGPLNVPVASIGHLIAMKTGTGRSKDQVDIDELLKIRAAQS